MIIANRGFMPIELIGDKQDKSDLFSKFRCIKMENRYGEIIVHFGVKRIRIFILKNLLGY